MIERERERERKSERERRGNERAVDTYTTRAQQVPSALFTSCAAYSK